MDPCVGEGTEADSGVRLTDAAFPRDWRRRRLTALTEAGSVLRETWGLIRWRLDEMATRGSWRREWRLVARLLVAQHVAGQLGFLGQTWLGPTGDSLGPLVGLFSSFKNDTFFINNITFPSPFF